ncbi:MAG: SDR family oxidoreductase [Chitinophagales bacterium]
MKDKLVVISGANAGIGFATAKSLLQQGAKIAMFCRNVEKAEQAKKELIELTNNDAIEIFQVDMTSFPSIENACNQFKEKYDKLDVLVNNAGGTFSNFELTEHNLEKTMAVNHFGYFLMTYHLLPLLKKRENARIVSVSSKAHYRGKIDFETINKEEGYFVFSQYEHSKFANVLFTKYLARQLKDSGITVNCLHPGVVKTKIGNKSGKTFHGIAWSIFSFFGINADNGAKTSVYLASSTDVENVSGEYFDKCKQMKSSYSSYDTDLQEKLWKWSEELAGVKYSF